MKDKRPLLFWPVFGLFLAVLYLDAAAKWLFDRVDKHLAHCEEHARFGAYVWHTHSLLRWRWLASHGGAYRDYLRWSPLSNSDIRVVVYPAGSRIGDSPPHG